MDTRSVLKSAAAGNEFRIFLRT